MIAERVEDPAAPLWSPRALAGACPSRQLTDRDEILAFLEGDRIYAAYAIGDLDPGLFEDCAWVGVERSLGDQTPGRQLGALALEYRGLDPPALLLITAASRSGLEVAGPDAAGAGSGFEAGLRALLASPLARRWSTRVYLTCRPEHLAVTREFYTWEAVMPMWRMALPPGGFRPVDSGGCQRLAAGDAEELGALYARGGGLAFSPVQVDRGVFFGLRVEGHLVSVAGTHLVSHAHGVAAVGNVYTHPDHRGRGYGTRATSAVVAVLLAAGIGDIVLNVGQENRAAIRIYERLGFETYCPFLEGPADRRA